jgi:hypothetical protein
MAWLPLADMLRTQYYDSLIAIVKETELITKIVFNNF